MVKHRLKACLQPGGDFSELFAEERLGTSILLDEGRVKSASTGTVRGAGMRLIAGNATGYCYCDGWQEPRLRDAARRARELLPNAGGAASVKVPERRDRYDFFEHQPLDDLTAGTLVVRDGEIVHPQDL